MNIFGGLTGETMTKQDPRQAHDEAVNKTGKTTEGTTSIAKKPIALNIRINGIWHSYEPRPDVTAWEAAMLDKLFHVTVVTGYTDTLDIVSYIERNNLSRHFVVRPDKGPPEALV